MGGFAIPQSARQLTHHTYREIFIQRFFIQPIREGYHDVIES